MEEKTGEQPDKDRPHPFEQAGLFSKLFYM